MHFLFVLVVDRRTRGGAPHSSRKGHNGAFFVFPDSLAGAVGVSCNDGRSGTLFVWGKRPLAFLEDKKTCHEKVVKGGKNG